MANFENLYNEKKRKSKITKELKKLNEIFNNLDETTKKTIENLIQEAAFMAVTLEETRMIIARDGVIENYQNGENQKGVKKSSAVEVYDKMVNTYARVIKQLTELLPKRVVITGEHGDEAVVVEDDSAAALREFISKYQ